MAAEQEIAQFLKEFREKSKIWDILFLDDRSKNTQALLELELRPIDRLKTLENLQTTDYSQGPLNEDFHGSKQMWVFGKEVKQREVYIKITMGFPGTSTICISFHISEHPMKYPFKKQ